MIYYGGVFYVNEFLAIVTHFIEIRIFIYKAHFVKKCVIDGNIPPPPPNNYLKDSILIVIFNNQAYMYIANKF